MNKSFFAELVVKLEIPLLTHPERKWEIYKETEKISLISSIMRGFKGKSNPNNRDEIIYKPGGTFDTTSFFSTFLFYRCDRYANPKFMRFSLDQKAKNWFYGKKERIPDKPTYHVGQYSVMGDIDAFFESMGGSEEFVMSMHQILSTLYDQRLVKNNNIFCCKDINGVIRIINFGYRLSTVKYTLKTVSSKDENAPKEFNVLKPV